MKSIKAAHHGPGVSRGQHNCRKNVKLLVSASRNGYPSILSHGAPERIQLLCCMQRAVVDALVFRGRSITGRPLFMQPKRQNMVKRPWVYLEPVALHEIMYTFLRRRGRTKRGSTCAPNRHRHPSTTSGTLPTTTHPPTNHFDAEAPPPHTHGKGGKAKTKLIPPPKSIYRTHPLRRETSLRHQTTTAPLPPTRQKCCPPPAPLHQPPPPPPVVACPQRQAC